MIERIKNFLAWLIAWPILLPILILLAVCVALVEIGKCICKVIDWAFTRTRILDDIL